MNLDFFLNNRRNISNSIEDKSVLVTFAGKAPYKRGDELYAFTPDRNFYYVTGIDTDNCILLLHKNNGDISEILYIQRGNGYLSKWVGSNMTEDEAKEKSGVQDIRYIDQFENDLASIVFKYRVEKLYLDLEKRQWDVDHSPAINFAKKFTDKYPYIILKDIYAEFAKLRSVKAPQEVECIRNAIAITKEGIELMLKNTTAGMLEYEIEAYFDYVMTKNGVRDKAFATIAASGKNATVLHYTANRSKTSDNDLILFDLGAQYQYYNADISRTYPVNGKFTPRQKQIYNIVLGGQKIAMENMRPGVPFTRPNEALKQYYVEELKNIGLIKQASELDKYYYHSVGHMLGLETHDIGRHNEGQLVSGMVITVEPGLYIEEEGIGIRIEDDILITEDGYENLSKSIIKSVDELEAFMKK